MTVIMTIMGDERIIRLRDQQIMMEEHGEALKDNGAGGVAVDNVPVNVR